MGELYPCRIVISSDNAFAEHYNSNPENSLMASSCVVLENAFELVNEERRIETIVLLNGEGEEVVAHLGEKLRWKTKRMPDIVRVQVSGSYEEYEKSIRDTVLKSSTLFIGLFSG